MSMNYKTILNIGLGPSKAAKNGISLGRAVDTALRKLTSAYMEFRTVENGEPTLVLVIPELLDEDTVAALAEALDQDCIAAVCGAGGFVQAAFLAGPEAAAWGPFDRSKFIFPTRNI